MISLDDRSRNILLALLRSHKPFTAGDIATLLGITPRMVRYSLKRAAVWLKERGVSLESRSNVGVYIDCTPEDRGRLISELGCLADDRFLSPAERLHVIILALLTEQEPVLAKQLESRLSVSRPTILRDMQNAEKWLRGHNLSVTSRPHFGFQTLGRERDRREAIVSLLLDSSSKELLPALCTGPGVSPPERLPGESGPMREFLQTLDIPYAKRLLDTAAANLQLQLSDSTYVSLVLQLALLIWRARQGYMLEFPLEHLLSISPEEELHAAKMIARRIHRRYNLKLAESEVAFITALLLASRSARESNRDASSRPEEEVDPRLKEMVENIITEASHYLHPYLEIDPELADNLTLHLRPVLIQLMFDLPIRNPLLEHIKRQYPYIFQVARKCSANLQEKTGMHVPEEEIGYITLHLGAAVERLRRQPGEKKRILVVCIEGVATAWLLVSRIQTELPDVEVVQVLSLLELRKKEVSMYPVDAIVATIPIEMGDIPVITINPLLRSEDISRLREELGLAITPVLQQKVNIIPVGDVSLADLITTATIRLQVAAANWMDVVDRGSEPLLSERAIEPSYVKAMKGIIMQYGPYSVSWPGVVLLHANPEDGVKRLCMSLTTFHTPVPFGNPENDPVDIALVIGITDAYSHLRVLRELTEMLADEYALTTIRNSTDRQAVRDIVCRFTHRLN